MDLGKKQKISKSTGRGDGFHTDFSMFLDRPHIAQRLGKKRNVVLNRTGGHTRFQMKKYLSRKKTKKRRRSRPGEPPLKIKGHLWRGIYYGAGSWDSGTMESVIVGPTQFKNSGAVSVPQLLNEGGKATIWVPGDYKRGIPAKQVDATYLPRPYATSDDPPYAAGLTMLRDLLKTVRL